MKAGCFIVLVANVWSVSADELRFDEHGGMLTPDQTYLEQGIASQGRGHNNDAMRYFKKSAQFGNPYAQSAIAFMHMQNKDYIPALAWFNLVDLKMIDNDQLISDLVDELGSIVSESELNQLQQLSSQLQETYGKQASLNHREKWQKHTSFGGSKIKGHIPNSIKTYPAGRIEQRPEGAEILVSTVAVSGEAVRHQMNEFIYKYEIKFTHGNVSLQDVELVEDEKHI